MTYKKCSNCKGMGKILSPSAPTKVKERAMTHNNVDGNLLSDSSHDDYWHDKGPKAEAAHDNSELDELFDEYFPLGTVTANDRKDDDKALLMSGVLVYRRNKFKQQILSNYLPKADLVEYLNGLLDKHVCRFNDGAQTCDCFKGCLDEIIKHYTEEK